jgi:hypothetical protein
MKVFSASTTIHASPERLWSILTDAAGYAEWDPYAIRIEGTIADGETITAYTKLSPKRAFPVKVGDFQPNRCMTWTGGLPLGLFKGVRSFNLTPVPAGVDFSVREEFSGPLLPLFAGSLPDMTEPFQAFVAGLKARAEHVDG